MSVRPELVLAIISLVWSALLTALFLRYYFYYSHLTKHSSRGDIMSILDGLVKSNKEYKELLDELSKKCDRLEKDGQFHVQKMGLLRFNPFKDTGGDQSFILALVDANDNGVVISSLHTRTGTRWYAKAVVKGKGTEYELSAEEMKALQQARVSIA